MRHWLAVLLLVLLPFQSVWAAAGRYCQHETGTDARHFGHHDHQHPGGDTHDVGSHDAPLPDGDIDPGCASCHLSGPSAVFAEFLLPELLAASPIEPSYRERQLTAPLVPRRERPKWVGLA